MDEINLSTNVNPLGPPLWFDDFLVRSRGALRSYQPLWHDALDEKLSSFWGTAPGSTFAIPGTSSFLYSLPHLLRMPQTSCVVLSPTFWEYEAMARMNGWTVHSLAALEPSRAGPRARRDLVGELDRLLAMARPAVAFLCEPNNPTGTSLGTPAIENLAFRHPKTIFLVDQTYAVFCPDWPDRRLPRTGSPDNILSLTSLSKLFCLPGLRVGVASFALPKQAEEIRRLLGPVRVDSLSAEVLPLLLADEDYQSATRTFVRQGWSFMSNALGAFDDLEVSASDTLFRFIAVRGGVAARLAPGTWLATELRARRIRVLDGAVYGVPSHVRLRLGTHDQNGRLLDALRECLS